jgi:hypothetical protein
MQWAGVNGYQPIKEAFVSPNANLGTDFHPGLFSPRSEDGPVVRITALCPVGVKGTEPTRRPLQRGHAPLTGAMKALLEGQVRQAATLLDDVD